MKLPKVQTYRIFVEMCIAWKLNSHMKCVAVALLIFTDAHFGWDLHIVIHIFCEYIVLLWQCEIGIWCKINKSQIYKRCVLCTMAFSFSLSASLSLSALCLKLIEQTNDENVSFSMKCTTYILPAECTDVDRRSNIIIIIMMKQIMFNILIGSA